MNDKVVVFDSGHGRNDPGSIACDGVHEAVSNWTLTSAVGESLTRRYSGVKVVYTHKGAETSASTSDSLADELRARADVANRIDADLLVSIHHDAAPSNPSARGASMCVWTKHVDKDGNLVWESAASGNTDPKTYPLAKVAVPYVRNALAALGIPWRWWNDPDGLFAANYGILRNAEGPAFLIECYMGTSKDDVAIARSDNFVPTLADAIADGIAAALGLEAVASPFADVPADAWYIDDIRRLHDAGLLNGDEHGNLAMSDEGIRLLVVLSRMYARLAQ